MQQSKIEFLKIFKDLYQLASQSSTDFPNQLCNFITAENELEACVLFKINEENSLLVLGRSDQSKKSYQLNSIHSCYNCDSLKSKQGNIYFSYQSDCEIHTTDFLQYESCVRINLNENNRVLFKLSKKSSFTSADKEKMEFFFDNISFLLQAWLLNYERNSNSVVKTILDIAHELRTPTSTIMGFTSLLNTDNLTASQAEYVATLQEYAYNQFSLINDLIELVKIENGSAVLTKTNIDLRNFISEIIKSYQEKFPNKEIDFIITFENNIPRFVNIDVDKIKFILNSLISNSIRLTEKGKITITISLDEIENLLIKISDSSEGFSSSKLNDFFKPFGIYDLAKIKFGNLSGLSLTLAKKYIELMNGTIDVHSSPGKGIIHNIKIAMEKISPVQTQTTESAVSNKKNRVLIVEDDYATSKLLSNYLTKWGYDPVIVNSAEQAVQSIEKEIFLAILMDIVLPDSNGFELMQKIRSMPNSKRTPVIVCSIEAEEQKAFLMGAVEYFVKPIKYNYLVEVLQSYKLKRDSNILIVDDDVPTLNLIKEAVQQAGFTAVAEANSTKVMSLIEDMNLDLAIIDLEMPELNGFDLIKEIKENPKFAKLPIIIYTGKEDYRDDLKNIDGLFEHLLEKRSTNIENLADTITSMINKFDEPTPPEELAKAKTENVVKILLAEDYKHSQIIVTRLLKKNNFNHIVVVENGAEALEQVKNQKFDLILMDMQMPVMNGFEATEKIRMIPEYKDTPIIALTAFAMKGDREKCLEAGATDYIPKPIDSHEFIEKVKYYTETSVTA